VVEVEVVEVEAALVEETTKLWQSMRRTRTREGRREGRGSDMEDVLRRPFRNRYNFP